ncbi:hypothetical protein nbrc107697_29380 [Gordonia crocea]|uniref:Uncharacterized protein n=1 Tax=Gordonia crocea TaxID=589162 RepID=A0A7I9V1L1_9ACTN|nr:hypothetical protein nbrc107697_29380 [Gordonia crocea]
MRSTAPRNLSAGHDRTANFFVVRIIPLDVFDTESCRRAHDVEVASDNHLRPWNSPPPFDTALLHWRHTDSVFEASRWLVESDGATVAVDRSSFPSPAISTPPSSTSRSTPNTADEVWAAP